MLQVLHFLKLFENFLRLSKSAYHLKKKRCNQGACVHCTLCKCYVLGLCMHIINRARGQLAKNTSEIAA